jgi:hypothetical protein
MEEELEAKREEEEGTREDAGRAGRTKASTARKGAASAVAEEKREEWESVIAGGEAASTSLALALPTSRLSPSPEEE